MTLFRIQDSTGGRKGKMQDANREIHETHERRSEDELGQDVQD